MQTVSCGLVPAANPSPAALVAAETKKRVLKHTTSSKEASASSTTAALAGEDLPATRGGGRESYCYHFMLHADASGRPEVVDCWNDSPTTMRWALCRGWEVFFALRRVILTL